MYSRSFLFGISARSVVSLSSGYDGVLIKEAVITTASSFDLLLHRYLSVNIGQKVVSNKLTGFANRIGHLARSL